jgi:hypothetical protein
MDLNHERETQESSEFQQEAGQFDLPQIDDIRHAFSPETEKFQETEKIEYSMP